MYFLKTLSIASLLKVNFITNQGISIYKYL